MPQWIRQRKIDDPTDARVKPLIVVELEYNRARLAAPAAVLPDYAAWAQWYRQTNGKTFGASFELEETGPLVDGGYGSNQIAAAISVARDEFVLDRIARHLNAHERVMVVFGASHLMLLRPALDVMLGAPCYQGSDLKAAAAQCLSPVD